MVYYSAEMCIDTLRYILLLYNASVLLSRAFFYFCRNAAEEGGFSPFSGVLYSQEGIVQSEENRWLTPEEIINMRWLADNVVGSLPHWDKLNEDAKAVVEVQGVDNIEE